MIYLCGTIAGLVMSALKFPSLPTTVPVHWGLNGQPDRYGSRWEAALFIPILLMVIGLIFTVVSIAGAERLGKKTIKALEYVSIGTSVFMLAIHYLVLSNQPDKLILTMPWLFSGLLIMMGMSVRGIERNPVMGIRLPWTMKSDAAWRRAHDSASKVWIIGGVVLVICSFFSANFIVVIGAFTALMLAPVVTSYFQVRSM